MDFGVTKIKISILLWGTLSYKEQLSMKRIVPGLSTVFLLALGEF